MKRPEQHITILDTSLTPALYQDLIAQLNKDLLLSGIAKTIQSDCLPNHLVLQLNTLIEDLVKNQYQNFNQFMYTLDVSEQKIKAIQETDLKKLVSQLSVLVLQRLLQKVILKQQYKSH